MSNSPNPKQFSNEKLFNVFHDNPKDCPNEVLKGAYRFMTSVVNGDKEAPTKSILIDIFNVFCTKPVKTYVFNKMGKKILLELALRILQELALGEPTRAETLQIEVVRAASGGKTLVIAEENAGATAADPTVDKDFVKDIDEAFFRLHDTSGSSPDVTFSSRQGRAKAPHEAGNFTTPTKSSARSLEEEFDSAASGESVAAAFDKATSSLDEENTQVSKLFAPSFN